ncbi:hypothetical protein DXB64_00020 [Bacteroides uniformis]|nr:hypothetical protein DXB64_00020 [Bacteroides uniformis]RGN42660.1 hypothetical protein DXB62_19210 [Bacteroides uniformis]
MNEIELRKYCLDKAIEILGWYKNFFPKKELHPLIISELIPAFATQILNPPSFVEFSDVVTDTLKSIFCNQRPSCEYTIPS